MNNKKKVLVSGIQSSGRLHIGNYFGAMRQNVELSNGDDFESYIFIADYHSMTSLTNADERRKSSFDVACAYLACGLDTEKVALFKQSDVPEHTELSWILSTITPMPMLMLAHSFKDKTKNAFEKEQDRVANLAEKLVNSAVELEDGLSVTVNKKLFDEVDNSLTILEKIKGTDIENYIINTGLFTYPVLMAADILMYQADVVPVGKDQEQHVEMTRELAGKFNRVYCRGKTENKSSTSAQDGNASEAGNTDLFNMPQAYIMPDVAIVPGTDGEKMSKSKGNVIPLFGTDEEIRKAVMSIVTDAKSPSDVVNPDENNIYNIYKLFLSNSENSESGNSDIEDLRNRFLKAGKYEGGSYSYKEAKDALYEAIIAFVSPMREHYDYYQSHPDEVYTILEKGKVKAQAKAHETMSEVRRLVGLDN